MDDDSTCVFFSTCSCWHGGHGAITSPRSSPEDAEVLSLLSLLVRGSLARQSGRIKLIIRRSLVRFQPAPRDPDQPKRHVDAGQNPSSASPGEGDSATDRSPRKHAATASRKGAIRGENLSPPRGNILIDRH